MNQKGGPIKRCLSTLGDEIQGIILGKKNMRQINLKRTDINWNELAYLFEQVP